MSQAKGSLDFLEGVTEETVEWRMLNMDSELVTANLSRTIGPGIHSTSIPTGIITPNAAMGLFRLIIF